MVREQVAEFSIQYVQALDEDGDLDESEAPDLDEETLREMYRLMKLSRRVDERAVALQRRGELGTYAPGIGQEAAQIGSALALAEGGWMVPSFREGGAYLARGTPVHRLLWYALGMEEGAEVSGGNFPPSIPVGSQPLHAAGVGWGQEMTGAAEATLSYFGDGATSQGDVYEAMNMAGVFDSHVVFLCQNNQYAISTPRGVQTRAETLAQKAVAAGIEGIQVDGNDVLGVHAVVRHALESARGGDPVLVEALTYRRSMHTTSDDPTVYRTEEEEAEWAARDPIDRFERYLLGEDVLDEAEIDAVENRIEEELADEIERARAGREGVDPAEMFDHVFAEIPPALREQRAEFERGRTGQYDRERTEGSERDE
ncbi:pyruvate dehydrogenase (acetyl-transferring) E1 component subunit alpha (plasmid) [Halorussus salilacus]|uniref:pyruvate dehydrogenase (acetyl-transferring) E1 component subunit alpha n=1 Tax=Halorussus salilacus TaxID=2953750 RepID=UPI00209D6A7F|nr:pyruvate dehydrogenase (acetyl-transferring) E1 component subunit alpha [Halorussus salilacus]USZ69940.1 pyruvate dehydrogenase (acetyl-transferring) E1 component subunit alpha [Halorussus salilacus]